MEGLHLESQTIRLNSVLFSTISLSNAASYMVFISSYKQEKMLCQENFLEVCKFSLKVSIYSYFYIKAHGG